MGIISAFQPACQKSSYHGISCTNTVHQFSLRGRQMIKIAFFCQQSRTFSAHGNQYVSCALFLQFSGINFDLFHIINGHIKDFTQFMMIGFDQKRMMFQYITKQVACGIHNSQDFFARQTLENILINGCRQTCRNASRQNQHIALFQHIQFLHQLLQCFFCNDWTSGIDFCAVRRFQFHIDAAASFWQSLECCMAPFFL